MALTGSEKEVDRFRRRGRRGLLGSALMARVDWEGFKQADAASYDPVAGAFDRLADRFARPVAERLVAGAALAGAERVLDIGTGTGLVAREAGRRLPACRVVGVDLSPRMLGVAKLRSVDHGAARTDFARMDAERLGFADATFDGVLSLYALLHFPHPDLALSEMYRVLRPGGRLAIAFGSAPNRWTAAGLADAVRRLRGRAQRLLGRRLEATAMLEQLAERHLGGSTRVEESRLAAADRNRSRAVAGLVADAGFEILRVSWEGAESTVDTAGQFWELQAVLSSRVRKRLEGASEASVAALRREFDERCRRVLARGGKLVYPHAALSILARRPTP